jgi:hypothetical protein
VGKTEIESKGPNRPAEANQLKKGPSSADPSPEGGFGPQGEGLWTLRAESLARPASRRLGFSSALEKRAGAHLPDRLGKGYPASAQIGLRRRTQLTLGVVLHPKPAWIPRYKRRPRCIGVCGFSGGNMGRAAGLHYPP